MRVNQHENVIVAARHPVPIFIVAGKDPVLTLNVGRHGNPIGSLCQELTFTVADLSDRLWSKTDTEIATVEWQLRSIRRPKPDSLQSARKATWVTCPMLHNF